MRNSEIVFECETSAADPVRAAWNALWRYAEKNCSQKAMRGAWINARRRMLTIFAKTADGEPMEVDL